MQEDCLEAFDAGQRRHRWTGFGGQVGRREKMRQMDRPRMCFGNDLTGTYRGPANERESNPGCGV